MEEHEAPVKDDESSEDSELAELGEEGPVRFSEPTDRSPLEEKIQIKVSRNIFNCPKKYYSFQ